LKQYLLQLFFEVVDLSCGYYHTAVISSAGDLYAWGEAEGGKLGLPSATRDTDYPRQVDNTKHKCQNKKYHTYRARICFKLSRRPGVDATELISTACNLAARYDK
jgi:alpha-tubulin suppressor-like RCC1 family protein